MHRFFVAPELLKPADTTVMLPEKLAHQVKDVLHIAIGEQIMLLDNSGDEVICVVSKSGRAGVEVEIVERMVGKSESSVHITLCQGLLKSARFEWVLEKGTEMGVTTFSPILCHRSMAGLEDAGPNKIQRWQRIIQEAAEQCNRAQLPTLRPIRPLTQALNDIPSDALAIIPWEEERELSLRTVLQNAAAKRRATPTNPLKVTLFIGPEGGLTEDEITLARRHNVTSVTLGTRIMRAETAAIATIANVMYELE